MALPIMASNPKYAKYLIGKHSYGEPRIEDFGSHATLEIGAFCSFARDVTILLSGEHRVEWVCTSPLAHLLGSTRKFRLSHSANRAKGDVYIGNAVWIGMGATILGGVTIGDGAVIGAQSVVTRDVQPYSITAGNPARFRKWRFPDLQPANVGLVRIQARENMPEITKRLLRVKWWAWDDDTIRQYMPLLLSDRLEEFLAKAEAMPCP